VRLHSIQIHSFVDGTKKHVVVDDVQLDKLRQRTLERSDIELIQISEFDA
jgi:hypothetical protein